jgi:peptide/nickel transport system ATP-binding protein
MGLETATSGKIMLYDRDIQSTPIEKRDTGTVSGDPDGVPEPVRHAQPVDDGRAQIIRALEKFGEGANDKARQDRMLELLDLVKLPRAFADRMPRQLSGGQKQRIGIARAFAGGAKVVVADEPVSALDVSVQAAVTDLLMDIQRKNKTTLLFISHDLSIVRYLVRPGDGDVSGPCGRAWHHRSDVQPALSPLYRGAACRPIPIADTHVIKKRIVLEGDIPSAMNPPPGCPFQTRCRWKSKVPGGLCDTVMPPMRMLEGGHQIKCHLSAEEFAGMEPVIKIAAE